MPKPVPKYKPLKSSPIRPPPYRCDYCGIKRRLVRHHLRGRGWDGADSDENISWVCGRGNESGCHGILHNNPSPRHDNLSFHGQDVPKKMRVIMRKIHRKQQRISLKSKKIRLKREVILLARRNLLIRIMKSNKWRQNSKSSKS